MDDIYSVAHELETHVTAFASQVQLRRRRLDLAVQFYTHENQVREHLFIFFTVGIAKASIGHFRDS